jgi:hypothetical protein
MAHDARPASDPYVAVCGTLPAVAIEAGGYRSPGGQDVRIAPAVVAAAFTAGLARTGGRFDQIVFAVLDGQRAAPTHAAFARARVP